MTTLLHKRSRLQRTHGYNKQICVEFIITEFNCKQNIKQRTVLFILKSKQKKLFFGGLGQIENRNDMKTNVLYFFNGLAYFWRVKHNNKQCATFNSMYLGSHQEGSRPPIGFRTLALGLQNCHYRSRWVAELCLFCFAGCQLPKIENQPFVYFLFLLFTSVFQILFCFVYFLQISHSQRKFGLRNSWLGINAFSP